MTAPLRLALTGAGHMGAQLAAAFHALDDVDVAAVAGRRSDRHALSVSATRSS